MHRTLSCCILLLSSGSALAEVSSPNACHQLSTDYIRLMCYDKSTGYAKPAPQASVSADGAPASTSDVVEQEGKQWTIAKEKSALHNREDVWLSVVSRNTEGNQIGSPERATLWLRCMENKTNVVVGFNRYTSDDQTVEYKLDDASIDTQWMEILRGGEGLGIWSGSRAIPFIKAMLGKETLTLAYKTYTGPVEFSFDISGLNSQIAPLATACGWEP
jgi:type VI secretion system protein VasI